MPMAKRSLSLADDVEHPQPQEQQEQLQQMPRHYWPGRRYCATCEVFYPSDFKFDAHLFSDQHAKKLKRATDYEPKKIALFNDLMIWHSQRSDPVGGETGHSHNM